MNYGKCLREIRKSRNISIYYISKETGISQSYISNLERGKNIPTVETMRRILDTLGLTLAEFFSEFDNDETLIVNEREREIVVNYRTMSEECSDMYYHMGKILKEKS